MGKSVSDKSTKSQILEAYEKLLKEVEGKSKNNPKEVQQRKAELQTVRQATDASPKSISDHIGGIKNEFISSVEKIESELSSERNRLTEIQNAIRIEEKHLEDLYGLTANADAFSAILLAQKEQEERFEREMTAKDRQRYSYKSNRKRDEATDY